MGVKESFSEHQKTVSSLESMAPDIERAAQMLKACLSAGNKILICGNGGSAADAQHFAAELVGRFKKERKGLPAIAITTNTSIITAIGNDYAFEKVFERQVEALGKNGDVLVAISTSGDSGNIISAAVKAKSMGMKTVALLGKHGGKMKGVCDFELIVPSENTPRIQEAHILVIHIMCEYLES